LATPLTGDEIGVHIVRIEIGMDRARGQMKQMVNDVEKYHDAAPNHGAGRHRTALWIKGFVRNRAGGAVKPRELNGQNDMQENGEKKHDTRGPKGLGHAVQKRRIMIDRVGPKKNLEIAGQVSRHKTEEDQAGDGHHDFLADGGLRDQLRPASNCSMWPVTLTLGKIRAIFPSGPITKVLRSMPMYFLPYMLFSFHTP
jgi:hypothetical protein